MVLPYSSINKHLTLYSIKRPSVTITGLAPCAVIVSTIFIYQRSQKRPNSFSLTSTHEILISFYSFNY